jgi:hypothetical protein
MPLLLVTAKKFDNCIPYSVTITGSEKSLSRISGSRPIIRWVSQYTIRRPTVV